jgi:hypothetical protein
VNFVLAAFVTGCIHVAFSGAAGAETAAPVVPPSVPITWDRAANIKEAAERIGLIQRTRGAEAAIKHIDACYRTHGLGSAYSAAFEGCIAQDYMETKLLVRIYGRLQPEQLRRIGAPTADQLAQAMGRRVVAAFSQYKVSAGEADAFKTEVDKVGMPVFLKTVFPNSAAEIDALGEKFDKTDKSKEKN